MTEADFDTRLMARAGDYLLDRNEPVVPKDSFDHHLIGSVSSLSDS
ncbi:hypothetical protein [Haloarcula sebkhae]|uniref:Uncharacterized protein n=1 Tax=Haloarcula sebkhae TaxID=932660 RepID=A0ACC6VKF7_9EURY|nr:hypothetical protein [Haloarcula sebkhae]